ncbi:Cell division cycle 5-like protein [Hypsibius exemplaris]|uniref:Cell division cycle 5-like protein n=1 Tax=Hypsibius exemplaris TaxID=2072580 RepID=A0A1W0WHG1_HYPEX|nr:Cell division cycle 5-like protein [Hypsibius exemplaris]
MPRILIKGGIWRNTEDEILKAAVMKYGKNQWSRIASLLHRKTSKQCKCRWYEWLDPSIKKTEWSREEEEKLLHLAKLMPTQWRTIAPIVGRTAAQCLEHYEYLLDQAQKKSEGGDDEVMDPRKLRPGEIDPNPETKPARPDPKDMDEDELEMLSEARARLANTQGKKAKRKAREKQLDEARRLASLQKRREMRAAGIRVRLIKKSKRMTVDYQEEIPFEKPAAIGFYDTREENELTKTRDFKKLNPRDLQPEPKASIEQKERKKDAEKMRKRKENEVPDAFNNEPVVKRGRLVLPEPQITDKELEEVVKIGRATEAFRDASKDGSIASQSLLSDYSATPSLSNLRTPRTGQQRDLVLQEAQNILALSNVETPLKGGENIPLAESDFTGVTPRKSVVQTPNVLLAALKTPGRQGTAGATPARSILGAGESVAGSVRESVRDSLGINMEDEIDESLDQDAVRRKLREGLSRLPVPKNDFEIVVPEDDRSDAVTEMTDDVDMTPDADDVEAERVAEQRARDEYERKLRSQAVQRGLPRPNTISSKHDLTGLSEDRYAAETLIQDEMAVMIHYDALKSPTGQPGALKERDLKSYLAEHPYDSVHLNELIAARSLIDAETVLVQQERGVVDDAALEQTCDLADKRLVFLVSEGRFGSLNDASKRDICDYVEKEIDGYDQANKRLNDRLVKMDTKLDIVTAGYRKRLQVSTKQLEDAEAQLEQVVLDVTSFEHLKRQEDVAIVRRMTMIEEDVARQTDRESQLQQRFQDLRRRLQVLQTTDVEDDA